MEAVNPELRPVSYELNAVRRDLSKRYQEIEDRATEVIAGGKAVSNPLLTGELKDTRYSLAVVGFLKGSVDVLLGDVSKKMQAVEPTIRFTTEGFRHITLGEVYFNPAGRRSSHIDAESARKYYDALLERFTTQKSSVAVELFRVFPAIDREQPSVSVVAAFLPQKDLGIYRLREKIAQAIQEKGLPFSGRLGMIPVIFSTIGRFLNPPQLERGGFPVLDVLREINNKLPSDKTVEIGQIDLLSTTTISYMWTDKHVYISPSISLTGSTEKTSPRFIIARKRRQLS